MFHPHHDILCGYGSPFRDGPRDLSIPVWLSLIKLFLELLLFNPVLLKLQGIMASDDQEAEVRYLEGWAFYLMTELACDSPDGKLEGEGKSWRRAQETAWRHAEG